MRALSRASVERHSYAARLVAQRTISEASVQLRLGGVRIPAESIIDSDASRSPVPSMAITRSEAT
jgi:hypothetical protein